MSEIVEKFVKLIKSKKTKPKDIENFIKNNIFDINSLDEKGYNALHYTIREEKPELVKFLLNYESENPDINYTKVNPNTKTKDLKEGIFDPPLLLALVHVNDDSISNRIIKLLIESGADMDIKDEEGNSFFLKLCEKGKSDLVNYILNKDPCPIDINKEKSNIGSALHFAILSDKEEIITLLLDNKIDIGIVDKDNNTALHIALIDNQLNYFKIVLDYLVNTKDVDNVRKKQILNMVNNEGNTILHELSIIRSSVLINTIKKLPNEISVDVNIKNKNGFDYLELEQDILNKKKEEEDNIQKVKEQNKKIKEEIRKEKIEQNKRLQLERQKIRERLERQELLGQKLMQYRGYFFLAIIICIMLILFALVKNATKKKELII